MSLIPSPLRRWFEGLLTPFVNGLVASGVNPNVITTVGTLVLVGAAVAFGVGAVRLGGGLLLLSGVFDMLDGRVARTAARESRFGAFYDSTLDRIGESALFTGIAVYFAAGGVVGAWRIPALVTAIVALSSGLIVSYARARAEGLDLECKVGIAQRAERILGLGVPSLFFGAGPGGTLLLMVVALLAVTALITVVQRIVHVYRVTRVVKRTTKARWISPVFAESVQKGQEK
jgi:CDP-diacylglycerol--glycerol-3-phosphate 3-phosphatidyltransferase